MRISDWSSDVCSSDLFPMLEPEEEFLLAKAWRDRGDIESAHKLVTSHLRLVAKIAMGYRGYGLPVGELISEGNVGMMQAVKRFDPDKGFRLSTYAMRSEEHTSELQSLMRISYAVFCLKKKTTQTLNTLTTITQNNRKIHY